MTLRPWARGPFELIAHGELHWRGGRDFDRRVALVSFDNAIEVCIATYLNLHPLSRGGRAYERKDIEHWAKNFHTKLEFLETECSSRGIEPECPIAELVYYHQQRNDQYHNGRLSAPDLHIIQELRRAAIWVFGLLYEVANVEEELELYLLELAPPEVEPEPVEEYDRVIDAYYGDVELAGGIYRASELLFRSDPNAYVEKALELLDSPDPPVRIVS